MSYVTTAQMIERYGRSLLLDLTDRADPPVGEINQSTMDAAFQTAAAMIDGYLATRYRLPLNPMSDLIQPLAEKLVIYDLHTYTPDQKITDEHKNAIATLKLIAAGTLRLPSDGIEPQGTGGTGAQSTDRDREMTPDKLSGFI